MAGLRRSAGFRARLGHPSRWWLAVHLAFPCGFSQRPACWRWAASGASRWWREALPIRGHPPRAVDTLQLNCPIRRCATEAAAASCPALEGQDRRAPPLGRCEGHPVGDGPFVACGALHFWTSEERKPNGCCLYRAGSSTTTPVSPPTTPYLRIAREPVRLDTPVSTCGRTATSRRGRRRCASTRRRHCRWRPWCVVATYRTCTTTRRCATEAVAPITSSPAATTALCAR